MKAFTTRLEKLESNVWGYHLPVPRDIAESLIEGDNRRMVCTLNGVETWQCALMPKGDGTFFINVNKELRQRLGLRLGMEVQVSLEKDESEYGLPMPEELAELFAIDDAGREVFHQLSAGKQRALLHIIGSPKRPETRIKKALVVIDYLKSTGGRLDFKELNTAFKEGNNLF